MTMRRWMAWSVGAFVFITAGAAQAAGYWAGIAEEVIAEINRAEQLAKAGQMDDAKEAVINSYFGLFEDRKMETAERSALGAAHMAEVENLFNDLRKAAGKPAGGDIQKLAESLRKTLRTDAQALDLAKVAADGVGVGK
jgi:hypothetical protein